MESWSLDFIQAILHNWGGWGAFFLIVLIDRLQKWNERKRLIEVIANNTATLQAVGGRVNDIYTITLSQRGGSD